MDHVFMSAQRIVEAAERYEQFHEVELAITIRTEGGRKSKLIRLRSEAPAPVDAKFRQSESSNHIEF